MSKYLETVTGRPQRKSLEERLREYPEVRARIEQMLDVMENAAGDVVKADEAEQRLIEELRKMGQEALQAWADGQQQELERYWDEREGVSRKAKKNSTGTRALE
jgi:hypothetical protein